MLPKQKKILKIRTSQNSIKYEATTTSNFNVQNHHLESQSRSNANKIDESSQHKRHNTGMFLINFHFHKH